MHDINATLRPALGSHSPVRDRHLQGIEGRDKTERQRVTEEYVRPVCHQGALYHTRADLTWGPVHVRLLHAGTLLASPNDSSPCLSALRLTASP